MLPPIPQKLRKIDASTLADHFFLDGADSCFYIWEYAARKGYSFSPANSLVWNLKIRPSALEQAPVRYRHKLEAMLHAAEALRTFMSREFVEASATFIPIPCSKKVGDAEYDNRLLRILSIAFDGWKADVREALQLTHSTPADHESAERLGFDELLGLTSTTASMDTALRPIVVILDDVLNSGKHFKVAQQRMRERYPDVEIRGLFLARCVRN